MLDRDGALSITFCEEADRHERSVFHVDPHRLQRTGGANPDFARGAGVLKIGRPVNPTLVKLAAAPVGPRGEKLHQFQGALRSLMVLPAGRE